MVKRLKQNQYLVIIWVSYFLTINNEYENKIIPVGGPGPARNSKEFGELIFQISGKSPKFSQVLYLKYLFICLNPFHLYQEN